jgi:hypothetical protein
VLCNFRVHALEVELFQGSEAIDSMKCSNSRGRAKHALDSFRPCRSPTWALRKLKHVLSFEHCVGAPDVRPHRRDAKIYRPFK